MTAIAFARLTHELAIWRRAWKTPVLWWRDDDCREPTWRLDRLLHARGGIPLTLAVIPDGDLGALARRLRSEAGLTIAQHGVDHVNKLVPGGPRSEFPLTMSQEAVNSAIAAGRARLSSSGLEPRTFVPPWNEASHRLIAGIMAARYDVYSIGIHGQPHEGLGHVGAQVDILRWKGMPRFRGRRRIFDALRKELEKRRESGAYDEPIGVLTHHLDMDERSWAFLDWFVPYARSHFVWKSFSEIWRPAVAKPAQRRFSVVTGG